MFSIVHHLGRSLTCLLAGLPLLLHAQNVPVLSSVSPSPAVRQLATVTLVGTDLQQAGYPTTVRFGGTPVAAVDMLVVNPQQLVVLVPAAAGSGPVTVAVGSVTGNALGFEIGTADAAPNEVIAKPLPGASSGRIIGLTGLNLIRMFTLGSGSYLRLGIPDARSITDVIRQLLATGLVQSASANLIHRSLALPSQHNQPTPNDPRFAQQYGPQRIRAIDGKANTPDAHRLSRGNGITIAVIDTGIDPNHEDLAGKLLPGINFTTVIEGDPDTSDLNSHGTHVAGIAAALTNNLKGIAGVAPKARLRPAKVLGDFGSGSAGGIAEGIKFAARHADVLNMSLGSGTKSAEIADEVAQAVGRGKVVVIAAGNRNCDPTGANPDKPCFPAALSDPVKADGIIAVANTDANDNVNAGSTRGTYVDVAAPGTEVLSTIPGGDLPQLAAMDPATGAVIRGRVLLPAACAPAGVNYCPFSGTSMATPHVAGVAALMLERDPRLTPVQVECLLRLTAVNLAQGAKSTATGDGRVDAYAAVLAVVALGGRFDLLPVDCNTWKPVGGPPPIVIPPPVIPPGPVPGVLPIISFPSTLPRPDQVLPITSDSATAFAATVQGKSLRVDLASHTVTNYAGAPVSDVVLSRDDQFAYVSEFAAVGLRGALRRIRLANNAVDSVSINPPVTEIALAPNGSKALIGTVDDLAVVDLLAFNQAGVVELDLDVVTGIAVTPDSGKALLGDPSGVDIVDLATLAVTHLATGTPLTGISLTPDGSRAVVGTAAGVAIIDVGSATFVALASGTPVSNIAIAPAGGKAAYASLAGVVLVDLPSSSAVAVATPMPVTDVAITPDGSTAVVGTVAGVSVVDIATLVASHVAVATPLLSGVTVSPDSRWAGVGTPVGVGVVDLPARSGSDVATAMPVTNVAITPNSAKGVVGTVAGVSLIDLAAKTATALPGSRPLIAATISDDSLRAVIGTTTGISVISIAGALAQEVSPAPPLLDVLPNNGQPPLNPAGERGKGSGKDG